MPQQPNQTSLVFPVNGIDVAGEFQQQPPGTTADALNVRSQDAIAYRNRGGSRPGISKRPTGQLNRGTTVFQELNVMVHVDAAALPQATLIPDNTWVPHPRTPGVVIPPGGSGWQPTPNPEAEQPPAGASQCNIVRITGTTWKPGFGAYQSYTDSVLVGLEVCECGTETVVVTEFSGPGSDLTGSQVVSVTEMNLIMENFGVPGEGPIGPGVNAILSIETEIVTENGCNSGD